jgi:hypothetical protein
MTLLAWGGAMYLLFSPNPLFWLGYRPHIPERGTHLVMFSCLAFVTYISQYRPKFFATLLWMCAFGMISEIIQYFEPPRTLELADFAEDVLGSLFGVCCGFTACRIAQKLVARYRLYRSSLTAKT